GSSSLNESVSPCNGKIEKSPCMVAKPVYLSSALKVQSLSAMNWLTNTGCMNSWLLNPVSQFQLNPIGRARLPHGRNSGRSDHVVSTKTVLNQFPRKS